MKKATLHSAQLVNGTYNLVPVSGYMLETGKDIPANDITDKYEFGIYKKEGNNSNYWYVIELSSGFSIAGGRLRKHAIQSANDTLNKLTLDKINKAVEFSKEKVQTLKGGN